MSCASTFGRDNAAAKSDSDSKKYIAANAVLLGAVSHLEDRLLVSKGKITALEEKNSELTHDIEIYEHEERVHKQHNKLLRVYCNRLKCECGFLKFVLMTVTGLLILNIAGFL